MTLTDCTCSLPPVDESRRVRTAQAAGEFYPQSPEEIAAEAKSLVEAAPRKSSLRAPIVLAPHAAWFYSGKIAAASIRELPADFDRLFVLAANHNSKADFQGISVERAHEFRMPGFSLPVNQDAVNRLLRRPGFVDVPEAHDAYVIEVELPLVRAARQGDFSVVPLIVGRTGRQDAARLARELNEAAGERSAFLFSLDMSHFYPDAKARELDAFCLNALSAMDADAIARCVTDGTGMLLVMNELAALRDLTPRVLAYANSSEAPEGDTESVVGYGSVIYEDRFVLSEPEGDALTALARKALETRLRDGGRPSVPEALLARFPRLKSRKSAFVTLTKEGNLRGCIGSLEPSQSLAEEVVDNAVSAALHDSRFQPVTAEELPSIELSVSVLDAPRPADLWHPSNEDVGEAGGAPADGKTAEAGGVDPKFSRGLAVLAHRRPGVTLTFRGKTSTFLPVVWEQLPDPTEFLRQLCLKQGAPEDCWQSPEASFATYTAQGIHEKSDKTR